MKRQDGRSNPRRGNVCFIWSYTVPQCLICQPLSASTQETCRGNLMSINIIITSAATINHNQRFQSKACNSRQQNTMMIYRRSISFDYLLWHILTKMVHKCSSLDLCWGLCHVKRVDSGLTTSIYVSSSISKHFSFPSVRGLLSTGSERSSRLKTASVL